MEHITGFYVFPWTFLREGNFQESAENNGQEGSKEPVALPITWEHPKAGLEFSTDRAVSPTLGFPEDRTVSLRLRLPEDRIVSFRLGLPEDRVARPFPSGPGAIAPSVSC